MPVKDYNADPDLNTQISGINIAEGCAPSGINNAIRQLMADVKEEFEGEEGAVSSLDSTIRALIAEEVAKYLPLSGGTMTGGIHFPSGYLYSDSTETIGQFSLIGGNGWGQGAALRLLNARDGGGWDIRAHNGTSETLLEGRVGEPLMWDGNDILTSAGGTMTGRLYANDTAIYGLYNNGRLGIASSEGKAAMLNLFGRHLAGDYAGAAELVAEKDTGRSTFVLFPDGTACINGDPILTSAGGNLMTTKTVVFPSVSGAVATMPSGGTWRYVLMDAGDSTHITQGTAAGGTKITHSEDISMAIAFKVAN